MRLSLLKHTVAVLRSAIGPDMTQKELARLVNRAPVTIQKIELGKLPLAESLGSEISQQTGVSLEWLMKNDVSVPPVDGDKGWPYTREIFDECQAELRRKLGSDETDSMFIKGRLALMVDCFCGTARSALNRGGFTLFAYKCGKALAQLEKDFGCAERATQYKGFKGVPEKWERVFKHDAQDALEKLFTSVDSAVKKPQLASSARPPRRRPASR